MHRIRGEKTAEALESNLTNLEKKIDDLLASFEESEREKVKEADNGDLKKEEAKSKLDDPKASKTEEVSSKTGEKSEVETSKSATNDVPEPDLKRPH